MKRHHMRLTLILSAFFALFGVHLNAAETPTVVEAQPRPAAWATPIELDGVPNLQRVDALLYRSAQPTAEGMRALEKLGIRTVINLRSFHSDSDELAGTALLNERLQMKTWHIEDEDVVRVLRLLSQPKNGPFLIHCQHGADRTCVICAMYRMVIQHWPRADALRELTDGGYGFHPIWTNIIAYLNAVDVAAITVQILAEKPQPAR